MVNYNTSGANAFVTDNSGNTFPYLAIDATSNSKNVTYIDKYAFYGNQNITTIDMSGATYLTEIREGAFSGCSNLEYISFPSSLIEINNSAFANCNSLKGTNNSSTLTIPNSVTEIGESAFYSDTSLNSLVLSSGLNTIGNSAFAVCTDLTGTITIPSSVTTIGDFAFYTNSKLTDLVISSNNLLTIGDGAFGYCTSLNSFNNALKLPTSLKTIGNGSFKGTAFTVIDITADVSLNITKNAFDAMPNLNRLIFRGNNIPTFDLTMNDGNAYDANTYSNNINVFIEKTSPSTSAIANVFNITDNNYFKDFADLCFTADSEVLTNLGNVYINELIPGVHKINGRNIIAVTVTDMITEKIVFIPKNALGDNIPYRDTRVSKNHKIFYNNKMYKSKQLVILVKGVKIMSIKSGEKLYNVLLKNYSTMIVNGLLSETLHPRNEICKEYIENRITKQLIEDKKETENTYIIDKTIIENIEN